MLRKFSHPGVYSFSASEGLAGGSSGIAVWVGDGNQVAVAEYHAYITQIWWSR